jgi:pilus assembly protein Flp/PilA
MNGFVERMKDFLKSEDGPTATEYAVMLALIIVAAIGSIQLVGDKVSTTFTNVEGKLPTVL